MPNLASLFSANHGSESLQIRHPLWRRLAAIGSGTVVVACISIGSLSWYMQSSMMDQAIQTKLTQAGRAIFNDLAAQSRNATSVAATIATEPGIAELVMEGNRDEIMRRYANSLPALKSEANLQMFTFSKAPGTAVLRIHNPEAFGDDLTQRRKMIVEAIRQGKPMIGIEPGRNNELNTFTTFPLVIGKNVVGVVDVGTPLGTDFFERLKKTHNIDLAIHTEAGDHFQTQSATFAAKTLLTPAEARAAFDGGPVRKIVSEGGKDFAVTAFPLQDFSGRKIGLLELDDDVTSVIQQGHAALWATVAGTALIATLSLVLFVIIAISLSRPIRNLTVSMRQLVSGDLQAEIEGLGRTDEIGAMAAAVQVFKDNALALKQATADQQRMEVQSSADRQRNEAERQVLAREQETVVNALASCLERLSNGDLTARINDAFAPEYQQLKDNYNQAVDRLRQTMTTVTQVARGIQSGTGEISQASDDLSRRTEQQAAALEQTAAALDEITATVRKSAEGANHARDLVGTADEDAKKSASVVREAVHAMAGIAKSAQEINQIIGVIDEIAFQTNLLALNAGVEAARAGDAGRGFAVVASEVRALAQRSAEAAKEIKQLISSSTLEVEHGVTLVGATGKALERIMLQVQDINVVIAEIAVGAREQATGLAEVNGAINQMDQVTQQNAAMVEQSTAASYSLSQETEQLANLIAQFQVGSTNDNQTMRRELKKVAPHAFRKPAAKPAARQAPKAVVNGGSAPREWEEF